MLRNKDLSILLILLSGFSLIRAQGFGERMLCNEDWSFHLGDITYGGREFLDHSEWRVLDLPHDWSVEGVASPDLSSCTGYLPGGIGWYRKNIDIPADREGQKVYVYFEGVYNNSEVFINGKWLGKRPNGYISFMYELTPFLNFGGRNVIAVRVDHSAEADSRWYTGSGIYRDVYLVYANPVHIDLWGVYQYADIEGQNATLNVETSLVNQTGNAAKNIRISQRLLDATGKTVAEHSLKTELDPTPLTRTQTPKTRTQSFPVRNPQRWSIESPYLYTLETKIHQGEKILDQTTTKVGFRTLEFDANTGFALNGKPVKLKGICMHHDAGALGAAVPKEVWRRRFLALKEMGCNAIRTSHNPQAEDVYDLCDEMGFVVMDEAFDEWEYPKKKWLDGWNVGEPGFQGSSHFFREWGKRDLADMIRQHRNHASIILWSIGNEVDYPNDPYSHPVLDEEGIGQIHTKGYLTTQPNANRLGEIAKELAEVVKQYDQSRPVTAALAGAVMSNHTAYPAALDVVGYNYTESRYDLDHKTYPNRVLYGSENRRDYEAWRAAADRDFIMGQFIWTGFDYLGEAGRWPSRGFTTGFIDLAGYLKPEGYFRKSLWSETPVAYLGTYRNSQTSRRPRTTAPAVWNYSQGDSVRVVCYTNCDAAELYLNGKLVGKQKKYDQKTGIIYWDIAYEAGMLESRAYQDGKVAASQKLETVGRPVAIQAKADKTSFDRVGELAHVEISMVDEQGRLVPFADNELYFRLSENLELLGTENGTTNPADNFKDHVHRCHNGRLLLYVKSGTLDEEGKITISSPMFEPVEVIFE